MPTYEDLKKEIFASENPVVPAEEVEVVESSSELSQPAVSNAKPVAKSNRFSTMAQMIMGFSLAAIVCAGTLLYLHAPESSKKKTARSQPKASQSFAEWLLGRKIDPNNIRKPFHVQEYDYGHEIRQYQDPGYGFAETN